MMYEKILDLFKEKKVVLEDGLTSAEVVEIERIYGIVFPKSLQDFLMTVLPVSQGFYNWRNKEQANVELIKSVINQPIRYIDENPEEIYWCEDWGKEPEDSTVFKNEVKKRLKSAPKVMPVFSHRYMPTTDEENPPVLSIQGSDVIYMGEDIEDYFNVEFGAKKQNEIDFLKINPIAFWSDLM